MLETNHHMSLRWDNSTPISEDGIAQLGLMTKLRVQVSVVASLRCTDHVQCGRPDSEEVIKQA